MIYRLLSRKCSFWKKYIYLSVITSFPTASFKTAIIICRKSQTPKVCSYWKSCAVCDFHEIAPSKKWMYLRKNNDNKIEPVPWITKESELSYTEASCKDFYKRFKSIYSSKSVPRHKNPLGYEIWEENSTMWIFVIYFFLINQRKACSVAVSLWIQSIKLQHMSFQKS